MSFFKKLTSGLRKTSHKITEGITDIFAKKKLDQSMVDAFEEHLICSDLGPKAALELCEELASKRFGEEVDEREVKLFLRDQLVKRLAPIARSLVIDPAHHPHVILMVGVNGTGKTTTLGKLAAKYKKEGKKVLLVAGDTFRAAAVEQLEVWANRAGVDLLKTKQGGDAAGLAYDALLKGKEEGYDLVMIDTAGRLQNKENLMAELEKIVRVIKKLIPDAPHHTLLTLDATTGQNALSQVSAFKALINLDGLILTKIDGSSKGGILVSLADQFALPVVAVGVGEKIDDLGAFDAEIFANSLLGLEE